MVGLYKDPKGEKIFRKISAVSNTLGVSIDSASDEVRGLRRRIRELEDEVKEKDVRMCIFIICIL